MSQTVALILQSKADADRIEYALAAAGFLIVEVRPSVFHVDRVPEFLRAKPKQERGVFDDHPFMIANRRRQAESDANGGFQP